MLITLFWFRGCCLTRFNYVCVLLYCDCVDACLVSSWFAFVLFVIGFVCRFAVVVCLTLCLLVGWYCLLSYLRC